MQTQPTTAPAHILRLMGFRDVEETDECLIVEMDNGPERANTRGALQGGLVATLIDIAAGRLAGRHVRADQDVATSDMTVHYLAPMSTGPRGRWPPSFARESAYPSSRLT